MNKTALLPAILIVSFTTGCSLAPQRPSSLDTVPPAVSNTVHVSPGENTERVKRQLYAQYREWKGTRYAYGGLSKRGIDCSGLVYHTFRERFGVAVPRSTHFQVQSGESIRRGQLRAGDLVFFKTTAKGRHVGIYVEDDKFLHVSSKKGVTISKLTDYYWRDRYWLARRIPFSAIEPGYQK